MMNRCSIEMIPCLRSLSFSYFKAVDLNSIDSDFALAFSSFFHLGFDFFTPNFIFSVEDCELYLHFHFSEQIDSHQSSSSKGSKGIHMEATYFSQGPSQP